MPTYILRVDTLKGMKDVQVTVDPSWTVAEIFDRFEVQSSAASDAPLLSPEVYYFFHSDMQLSPDLTPFEQGVPDGVQLSPDLTPFEQGVPDGGVIYCYRYSKVASPPLANLNLPRIRSDIQKLYQLADLNRGRFQVLESTDYSVTCRFNLKGIIGVNENGEPEISTSHVFVIKIHSSYPVKPPHIYMLTKLFHPNVSLDGRVCAFQHWDGYYDDLIRVVLQVAGIIQYRAVNVNDEHVDNNQEASSWYISYREKRPQFFESFEHKFLNLPKAGEEK